ncbi:thioesterase [Thermaurantimonas aggregans]|uniref:Thioesterase n=1 Tax=Thermaurantimonas aggregans TaxID=2173829 RepID=A0A401XIZ9_9FLAO|nr:acyl-CoA thioesterase [Thermaurantimonas aggregans]MCX8149018.1 acyl-CoA thioesterase [Thermaurantimonas aggregans]GCD76961.1 thioesterase [Thermaurantimonas aggregans]
MTIGNMTERNFSVELILRIDWSELDYFGHVNNVSFFKYIQASRVNYWDKIGLTEFHRKTNIGPMLASCKCDFKQPLFYPGQIKILSRVDFIKNTSFSICHRIIDDKGQIAAEAQDIMVMFDFNQNKKIAFPDDLKKKIERLENIKF